MVRHQIRKLYIDNIGVIKSCLCLLQDFPCVAIVGLGKNNAGVCGAENWDTSKENIRQAVSGESCDSAAGLSVGYVED